MAVNVDGVDAILTPYQLVFLLERADTIFHPEKGEVDRNLHQYAAASPREGMPGKPVLVELDGAKEFVLQIEETPDGISCDQADWAEAKVTLKDGSELWLADLPLRDGEKSPYTTEPPFSFVYGGKASSGLLKDWPCRRQTRKLDAQRTERTSEWIDPATGLQVRLAGIEYGDFPTVEWVVHFKNPPATNSPLLESIQALDTALPVSHAEQTLLHWAKGAVASFDDFAPFSSLSGDMMTSSSPIPLYSQATWRFWRCSRGRAGGFR